MGDDPGGPASVKVPVRFVLYERADVESGAAEPESVPAGRARHQVRGSVEQGVQECLLARRGQPELRGARDLEETMSEPLDAALSYEPLRETRRVLPPPSERRGAEHLARCELNIGRRRHGMKSPPDNDNIEPTLPPDNFRSGCPSEPSHRQGTGLSASIHWAFYTLNP